MRILDKEQRRARARQARHGRRASATASSARSASPTAPCSSPARPARASRRRSTPRSSCSTRPRRTSSRSRTRSSTRSTGITQVQVNPQGRADLRQRAALDAARRPRRHHGRRDPRPRDRADRGRGGAHRPPRPLHAAHQRRADARSRGCPRWASSRSWSPAPSTASSPSAWRARSAPSASSGRSSPPTSLREHGFPAHVDLEAYEPVGCARCGGSGYKGRMGLYEVMRSPTRSAQLVIKRPRPTASRRSPARRACASCATTASRRSRGPDLDRRDRPRRRHGRRGRI